MAKKSRQGRGERRKPLIGGMSASCVTDEEAAHERKALAAIGNSSEKWVRANSERIRQSSREECALKSYMGGMFDMLMVARHALGMWGAEQIVSQLVRMSKHPHRRDHPASPGEIRVQIASQGKTQDELAREAEELGKRIAAWMKERDGEERRRMKDPMFA